jgi:uncharacterized Zn-binding protein involved in type VI secretion
MERAVICKGDRTSHGGIVLEGDEICTTGGRPITKIGHMTFCPQCKGKFPIIEGLSFFTFLGVGTVVDGMKTACGATVTASQHAMVIDVGSGGGGAVAATTEQDSLTAADFGGMFKAVDNTTGKPVHGMHYRIELSDGRVLQGVTNEQGETERLAAKDRADAKLYWEAGQPDGSE